MLIGYMTMTMTMTKNKIQNRSFRHAQRVSDRNSPQILRVIIYSGSLMFFFYRADISGRASTKFSMTLIAFVIHSESSSLLNSSIRSTTSSRSSHTCEFTSESMNLCNKKRGIGHSTINNKHGREGRRPVSLLANL